MDFDLNAIGLLLAGMLGPAAVVLIIYMVLQRRRSKFHRQRITKGKPRH
jgi:hypothetical protein